MDYLAEPPKRLLCWTVCAYKRPDLSDDYYHKYMSEVHGPLVKDLMVKYRLVKWSMVSSLSLSPESNRASSESFLLACKITQTTSAI